MKNQLRNDAWGPTIFWVWPLQDSSKELCRKVMERQYENYKDVIRGSGLQGLQGVQRSARFWGCQVV